MNFVSSSSDRAGVVACHADESQGEVMEKTEHTSTLIFFFIQYKTAMAAPPPPPPLNPLHTPAGAKPSSPFSESERECFWDRDFKPPRNLVRYMAEKEKKKRVVGEGWRWDTQRLRGKTGWL